MTPDEEELEAAHFMLWQVELETDDDPTVRVDVVLPSWRWREVVILGVSLLTATVIGCGAVAGIFYGIWRLASIWWMVP